MDTPVVIDDEFNSVDIIQIPNLHCNSCVFTIEQALSSLSPPPTFVQISIECRSVTLQYPKELSPTLVISALEDVGFDAWTSAFLEVDHSVDPSNRDLEGVKPALATRRSKHLQQCSLCQQEEHCIGYDPIYKHMVSSIASGRGEPSSGPFRLTLAVGGMSCSSCSMTITKAVSDLQGVSDVAVSLLAGSATVIIDDKGTVEIVVTTVEDCGFDVEIMSVEPLTLLGHDSTSRRTLTLCIDGMFCRHCPEKVMAAVESLSHKVQIVKPITTRTDRILELSYQPSAPSFTLRTIISTIASSNSPPFRVSIQRPPSLEERAQSMQASECGTLLRRLILTIVIGIPTFLIGVVFMSLVKGDNPTRVFLMEPLWVGNASRSQWFLLFLASPVQFYSAEVFHRRCIKELSALWKSGSTIPIYKRFTRFGSMNLLVSAGVSVAYFSSVGLLGLAAAQPASPSGMGETTTYFDSVVFLTGFILAGRVLEAYSKTRTADAISALALLRPSEALLLSEATFLHDTVTLNPHNDDLEKGDSDSTGVSIIPGSKVQKVDASLLEIGDIVRIQRGATPPADAIIVCGSDGAFDESSLSGESRLVNKTPGDKVFLGTVNKGETVDARVDAIGGATMLDHIVALVREGQTRRAPIERFADLLISYFVPAVTSLAIVTWVVWLSLGLAGVLPHDYLDIAIGGWPVWSLEFAIAVFVVACPCGIGLAAPTAILVGSGLAAKFGILARGGGESFQEMAHVDIIVFDKTGTLTEGGEPTVSDFEILCPSNQWDPKVVLGIVAELESTSSHPLGKAVLSFCGAQGASTSSGSMFQEVAGRGIKAHFELLQCTAIIGNEAWLEEHGTFVDNVVSDRLGTWKSEAKSVILFAIRDESQGQGDLKPFAIAAIFAVTDRLRPEARSVISCLQRQGIGVWMISGDNAVTARAVAKTVGIPMTNVIAGVLPHEKAQNIQWLQQVGAKRKRGSMFTRRTMGERCIVAMVGDGINDAPALTAADIGIAIGSGSDVAISSASFILLSSNLRCLLTLGDISRKVFNRVKLNFLYATAYNIIALPVAAGVFYPAGRIRLAPVWASLAMAFSSVSVVCSSLLLKLYKEPSEFLE